ncbi:MAG: winged helix-turn-helix domain-containing protein [Alphaproteobacteria bacterium]|nr:winged helix-turn-helix domain-containing protein [Alphaproteobacteria bacterium]
MGRGREEALCRHQIHDKHFVKHLGYVALPADRRTPMQKRWTFFTNHAHVLFVLDADPDLRLRDVADRVGITERAAQRIVRELQEDGYLRVTRVGRRNRYEVLPDAPLRHPVEGHRTVGEVAALVRSS